MENRRFLKLTSEGKRVIYSTNRQFEWEALELSNSWYLPELVSIKLLSDNLLFRNDIGNVVGTWIETFAIRDAQPVIF